MPISHFSTLGGTSPLHQIKPTTVWVDPSSTGVTRRRGALRSPGHTQSLSNYPGQNILLKARPTTLTLKSARSLSNPAPQKRLVRSPGPGMDDGVRQRAPHRRAARPHHSPCPYPGDERRELPAQAEPVTTPATVRITPRLSPWAHRPLPRAGRRQPRRGRVDPRAGPSRGLPGQAATEPVGHFCAAAPVHFYAAVDTGGQAVLVVSNGTPIGGGHNGAFGHRSVFQIKI